MNLNDIITKPYILALIIRDDGERLLLGDGTYDFKDTLQHFQADTFANDVVELQGADGQLLAGQVRRAGTQKFAGYIGDASMSKQKVEELRRAFLMFFRKKHFYKVVYIFCDGTAIQRKRGYIVNPPTAPEMWQKFPEYSISLNFEDVNYYEYEEDEFGDEIYAHIVQIALAKALEGGLVWDAIGAVTNDVTWSNTSSASGEYISIDNALDRMAPLASVQIDGNATQTTYSGKNLCSRGYYESTATARFEVNKSTLQQTFTISYISDVTAGNATIFLFTDGTNRGSVGVTIQQTAGVRRSATITLDATNWGYIQNATAVRFTAYLGNAGHTTDATITQAMVENGSTMTDYEPYVGGTASPNPDYPQPISVVTGENVVKIEGKNLCYEANRVSGTSLEFFANCASISNSTMTLSLVTDATTTQCSVYAFVDGVDLSTRVAYLNTTANTRSSATLNLSSVMTQIRAGSILRLLVYRGGAGFTSVSDAQLELGSTATAYEPYQGQEYTIDLDTIELAKIGTYQDYIWKDGDEWKVHKEVGKVVLDGSETWSTASTNLSGRLRTRTTAIASLVKKPSSGSVLGDATSSHFVIATSGRNWEGDQSFCIETNGNMSFYADGTITQSTSDWTTWLASNPTTVYYALATPTDTIITNQTLIDQLNALEKAKLFVGQNNISTNTLNATPTLELEYYSAYTEEGAGYEWEPGGGSQNIITVDGIDNARPIWQVVGPANNPTLTNITTGQTISWQSFVPIGQTLTIDMNEMTADLAGANVFEYITGTWIELRPGNNTLVYTADGGAEADSTLSWNGVAS